jgi:hypothetical protein
MTVNLRVRVRTLAKHRKLLFIGSGFLLFFVLINVVAYIFFASRAFPQTIISGQQLGNRSFAHITKQLQTGMVDRANLTITYENKKEEVPLERLGTTIDTQKTVARLKQERSWLPLLNFFRQHHLEQPSLVAPADKLEAEATRVATTATRPATDAKIELQNGLFSLVPAQNGTRADKDSVKQQLGQALQDGVFQLSLRLSQVEPAKKTKELEPGQQSLRKQQETPVTLVYQQKVVTPAAPVIAGWYSPQGDSFALNADLVKAYVRKQGSDWGIVVDNIDAVTSQISKALTSNQKASVTLVARKVVRQYSYCIATNGVDNAHLSAFGAKLAAVLNDARGWSIGGQVGFSQATSGCSFTAWLTAPSKMSSFGAICDAMWSCRVGNNVVINFDRWQFASPAWNASGGSLEDYRAMVINHETGHWLEFGHSNCGGAGQPAPVMQQQSIDLAGCVFNPWPLPSELAVVRGRLGLP